jgi:dTDP-4-dehydrorhamnose reductase
MLGHLVVQYLKQRGYPVLLSQHRYSGNALDPLIDDVKNARPDVVINCAGVTTHRPAVGMSIMASNALLPLHLTSVLTTDQLLIHPSTDCVFDGQTGNYSLRDQPNSQDPYGLSKRLGEVATAITNANVAILRTSIVGPEQGTARGLMAWFLSQSGPVDGWVDHVWNGITTLAWAQLCVDIALGNALGPGMHQPTTEASITKFDLLHLFGNAFDHRIEIRPKRTGKPVNRVLRPSYEMPPIDVQLADLRSWMASLP